MSAATPRYGYEMIEWEDAINLGLMYAVRTLDPLTGEINNGSNTLAYCATRQQAVVIVCAVNSHEELLKAAKEMEAELYKRDGKAVSPKWNKTIAKAEARS